MKDPLLPILNPVDVITNYVLATPEERKIIDFNLNATGGLPKYQRFLGPYKLEDIPSEYHKNFFTVVDRVLELEKLFDDEFIITNLYRSTKHHKRIYLNRGFKDFEIPMGSSHLIAFAVDIVPKNKSIKRLHEFLSEQMLTHLNAWQEHPVHTKTWAHLQFRPYPSWHEGKSRKFYI